MNTKNISDKEIIAILRDALAPFAECAYQISTAEDDEEWAKFRLIVKNYRTALAAYNAVGQETITIDRVIEIVKNYGQDSRPRSDYRLACDDLVEKFEEIYNIRRIK